MQALRYCRNATEMIRKNICIHPSIPVTSDSHCVTYHIPVLYYTSMTYPHKQRYERQQLIRPSPMYSSFFIAGSDAAWAAEFQWYPAKGTIENAGT